MAVNDELIGHLFAVVLDPTVSGVLGGLGTIATGLTGLGVRALHRMSTSMGHLNSNIETIIKRIDEHDRTLIDHEARLRIEETETQAQRCRNCPCVEGTS